MKSIPILLVTLSCLLIPVAQAAEWDSDSATAGALGALNKQLTDAYEREDTVLLRAMLSDAHVHNNVFGAALSKDAFLADIESGTLVFESYKTSEIQWRVDGKTAIATGLIEAEAVRDGKPVPATRFRFTRIWILEDDTWRVLLFQNTMAK